MNADLPLSDPAPKTAGPAPKTADAISVASVAVDNPLPHLDRPFDYAVPAKLQDTVTIGSRVRVPFSGRLVNAVVTGLAATSQFEGKLSEIRSTSASPSFTPSAIDLARRIARRYGGSVWDVLRLMAPPRVAAVEKRDWSALSASTSPGHTARQDAPDPYRVAYEATSVGSQSELTDYLRELLAGAEDRVIWEALPDHSPRTTVATKPLIRAVLQVAVTGASAIVVVPDARSIAALQSALKQLGLRRWTARSGGEIAVLDHDDGPAVRFGNYLAAMHGHARIVIGTRPTAMQPVPRLGLIAVWDEANGALEDPHAPYPHARTIAAMRAEDGAALILGGYALSAQAVALVEHGWATLHTASRDQVRDAVPAIDVLTAERRDAEGGSGWHWMPGSVWRLLRAAVTDGPVAIMVPRAGYVRATACARCEAWAECRECSSLLGLPSPGADPVCLDEGHVQVDWHCSECQGSTLKHVRQGAERIAEQLERMLGDITLTVSSAAAGIVPDHQVTQGVVLATPGALPAVVDGYRHLVVLDAGVPAGLGLGGELKAIRWWLSAAALVRSRRNGGAVTVVGEVPPAVRRALSSWSPAEAALAEYQERSEIGLPPHRRYVTVHGETDVVNHALELAGLRTTGLHALDFTPDELGLPALGGTGTTAVTEITLEGGVGVLLARSQAQAVVDSLRESVQAASKAGRELRLRVDGPLELPR